MLVFLVSLGAYAQEFSFTCNGINLSLTELDCYENGSFNDRRIQVSTNLDLDDYEMLVYERKGKYMTRIFVAIESMSFTETDNDWDGTITWNSSSQILTIHGDNDTENIFDLLFT